MLTGKYRRGEPGPPGARLSGRDEIATAEQVRANAAAARWHPTPADLDALAAVLVAAPA